MLDEVVVVGYGTQKKVNVTGAVSMVDSKVLESRPVQNVAQALQGQIPGLNMSVGNSGGALDASLNINIRGAGTIGDGSSGNPLILIDGIEGDMNTVNPNDIANVSVLKDAAYLWCACCIRCYFNYHQKRYQWKNKSQLFR